MKAESFTQVNAVFQLEAEELEKQETSRSVRVEEEETSADNSALQRQTLNEF